MIELKVTRGMSSVRTRLMEGNESRIARMNARGKRVDLLLGI